MRKTKRSGGFFLCLLLNMFSNLEGLIPAVILLVLHFWLGWSVWWAGVAAAVWVLWLVIWMKLIGWAGDCSSTPDPKKQVFLTCFFLLPTDVKTAETYVYQGFWRLS